MKAEEAFTRSSVHVPPEQVMTRLMRRADYRERNRLDYSILLACAAGIFLGVVLAFLG